MERRRAVAGTSTASRRSSSRSTSTRCRHSPSSGTSALGSPPARDRPGFCPGQVRRRFAELTAPASRRGLVLEALALQFEPISNAQGLQHFPSRALSLSRDLYGDPGMRSAVDLDFLVPAEQLDVAVRTITARGYTLQRDVYPDERAPTAPSPYARCRPAAPGRASLAHPLVRDAFLAGHARSQHRYAEGRRARPEDELASLLLFYARDGFVGLRLAADIAAWWDRHGQQEKSPVLDAIAANYPQLRDALRVTAGCSRVWSASRRLIAFRSRSRDLASAHRDAASELGGRRRPASGEREHHLRGLAGGPAWGLAAVCAPSADPAAGEDRGDV